MGNTGRKSEPPKQADEKSEKQPPPQADDDDWEHGDIATPNGEHYGNDDEPL
jgi:hypothetical protein